jgi:SAM-dependent MidA family methyltransferase
MTKLAGLLKTRIAANGPITLADYMADCLLHPEYGYYSTRDPFGTDGDFTTAPEISQMFGELLGLALAQTWLEQGSPDSFVLSEPGPGRGTLMSDVLRATRGVAGFHEAAQITLVEASPVLRDIQLKTLAGHTVNHVDNIGKLPTGPLFLLANEFFDALPIRQFVMADDGWSETHVGLVDGELAFGLSDPAPLPALEMRRKDCRVGDLVETCAPATAIADEIGARIKAFGGAAIIIDYGDWRSLGDTLQALRKHEFDTALAHPGEADLTAHVDFEALSVAAIQHTAVSKMVPQGTLLERLGIRQRADVLAQGLSGDQLETHQKALHRLTDPTEMGTLFKAIAIYPPDANPPPGFPA